MAALHVEGNPRWPRARASSWSGSVAFTVERRAGLGGHRARLLERAHRTRRRSARGHRVRRRRARNARVEGSARSPCPADHDARSAIGLQAAPRRNRAFNRAWSHSTRLFAYTRLSCSASGTHPGRHRQTPSPRFVVTCSGRVCSPRTRASGGRQLERSVVHVGAVVIGPFQPAVK